MKDRWQLYKELGLLPSTGESCMLEYPWGQSEALESIQDIECGELDFCPHAHAGKWLLFYPLEELDEKRKQACEFFEAAKLKYVHHIATGTFQPNTKSPPGKRCMTFYCCIDDPFLITKAGLSIVKLMKYPVCCYYRTNLQSQKPCNPGVKNFTCFIRPEMHNAEPDWSLERFFPNLKEV